MVTAMNAKTMLPESNTTKKLSLKTSKMWFEQAPNALQL